MITNKEIRQLIEQYDSIVIYRHIHSDYDAYGAQLGLKHLLTENYPDKKVYTVGITDIINPDFLEEMDNPDLSIIRKSLAILVDTSNAVRVEGDSYQFAKETLRIDHHPHVEDICDHEHIDTGASSASQLILELAKDSEWLINEKAAGYLYSGISTDTLKMTIDKVDKRLFEDMAYLYNTEFRTNMLNRQIYDQSVELFSIETKVRNKIIFDEDVAYIQFTLQDLDDFNLHYRDAKDMINIMGNIKGINKYAIFLENENSYNCSLRSHDIPVLTITEKYNGGGHPLACGIPVIREEDIPDIVRLLKEAR